MPDLFTPCRQQGVVLFCFAEAKPDGFLSVFIGACADPYFYQIVRPSDRPCSPAPGGRRVAGGILCNLTDARQYVAKKVTVASYLLFSPVFFAGIGLRTDLSGFHRNILLFALLLAAAAVLTKIIGCGLAARLCRMSRRESLTVGVGMVARGEVALMVAQKGVNAGYIDQAVFPAIVLCVVTAALITPALLKVCYRERLPQKR